MRAVSPKRAKLLRLYAKARREFLEARPSCERCGRPATCVHHKRGRFGMRLLNQDYWAASCHDCNTYAETHTGQAIAEGWLLPIEAA